MICCFYVIRLVFVLVFFVGWVFVFGSINVGVLGNVILMG